MKLEQKLVMLLDFIYYQNVNPDKNCTLFQYI